MKLMQFEEVLGLSDPKEDLHKLVDPRLGENYPLDSVFKVVPTSLSYSMLKIKCISFNSLCFG